MRIASDGKVGIGTNDPDEALHVEGNILLDVFNNAGAGGGIFFREGFGTAQPSITLLDHSGANADGLSVNSYDGTTFKINDTAELVLKAGKLHFQGAANAYLGWSASGADVTLAADDDLILHADDDLYLQAGGSTVMTLDAGDGDIDTTYRLHMDKNVTGDIDATASAAIFIDYDSSGSAAAGGQDNEQVAIYIDQDSSATGSVGGGDEIRNYGIYVDQRQTGNAYYQDAIKVYQENEMNADQDIHHIAGIYTTTMSQMTHASASIAASYGAYHTLRLEKTGTNTNNYGIYQYTEVNSDRESNVGNIYGFYNEIDIESGNSNSISTGDVFGIRSRIDHNDNSVTTASAYLGYFDYDTDGGNVGTAWGLYVTNEDKNYLSGKVGIGTTSPDARLEVESEDGSEPGLKVYRNDSSTSSALVYIHDDSVYGDNAALHVKQDSTASYGNAALFEGNVGINTTAPVAALEVHGSGVLTRTAIISISGNTNLSGVTHAGRLLRCTSACTLSLQATPTEGEQQVIFNDSSGTITIAANGSDTINGSTDDITITSRYKAITVIAVSASAWLAIGA
jgi:hypothetical protein